MGLTLEDAAAATAIATTTISHAKQRPSIGSALNNASIAAKVLKFPTIIGENDDGTAITEITLKIS